MKHSKTLTTISSTVLAMLASAFPGQATAAPYSLPDVPLIVAIESTPNVFMEMDDSGSMDWEILAPQHFTLCAYDGFASNRSFFTGSDTSGDTKSYCATNGSDDRPAGDARMLTWFYDEGASSANRPRIRKNTSSIFYFGTSSNCNNADNVERCEDKMSRAGDADTKSMDMDWRIRSSALNVVYFDPSSEYEPWVGGSTTYADANWDLVRSWPDSNEGDYNDTRDLGSNGGFTYNVWIDDKGYSGVRPTRNNMTTVVGGNGEVDLWDSHVRVTVTDSAVTCEQFTITTAGTTGMDANRNSISCSAAHTGGQTLDELKQSIANWFQYGRRRVHVSNYALGKVLTDLPDYRYGLGFINNGGVEIEMPDAAVTDYSSHIRSILNNAYRDKEASGQTPLRGGLDTAGRYYADLINNVDSPIINSCQKNFTVLFTDGYWDDDTGRDDDSDLSPISDEDGDGAQIYGNRALQSTLLADVAKYYYDTDLRTDLVDAVPTDTWDSASHQHMVTFTINFGSAGLLNDTDNDGWPGSGIVPGNFDWYSNANTSSTSPSYWDPRKADDMWHAAWNSKGTYVSAGSPKELVDSFKAALENIGSRIGGAASAAANSGSISSNSRIFQAKFDTSDWHGELLAFPVNSDGTLGGSAVWNADTLLTAKSNAQLSSNAGGRNVWTWNNDGNSPTGTAFEWNSISSDQQALLNQDANGVTDGLGANRLTYVRGSSAQEQANGGVFRNRSHKMGDIVNSDPVYVGFPPFFYSFGNYQSFFTANVSRTGVIYLGANDGMLHAIRESDGEQLFAYVPDKVIKNLPELTDPGYGHKFFVDGKPEYGDVQINGNWKSVVAATLRAGGQGLFALDVTNPDTFASGNVLWEFTDEVDADLGYTYSQPQIRRMANDKWAVIIGNGLNNTEADGHASTSGAGALFIIYIEEGINGWSASDYVKITVPGGSVANPNALFTPAAADLNGDNRVDAIYAGDRNGKMWKFDVSSPDSLNWDLAFNGNALFDAGSGHPITDRPAIAAHPMGAGYGQLVVFGTGQYIQKSDNTNLNQPTQSLYSIWDLSPTLAASNTAYGYSRSDLSANSFSVSNGVRVISSNSNTDWFDNNNVPNDRGWYIDLPTAGERIVRRPVLRDNLVFFVSLIPDDDPCSAGGTGWLMVMDIFSGSAPTYPVFDIDGDLDVSYLGDMLDSGTPNDLTDDKTPAGVFSPSIPNLPAIIYDDRPDFNASYTEFPPVPNMPRGCDAGSARAYTFTTGSNGSILSIETASEPLSCGRQSWNSDK